MMSSYAIISLVISLLLGNGIALSIQRANRAQSTNLKIVDPVNIPDLKNKLVAALPVKFSDYVPESAVSKYVTELELTQQKLGTLSFPSLWPQIDGEWILRYTNNIQRGGEFVPPFLNNIGVLKVDSVIQKIDSCAGTVEHILQYSGILSVKGGIILKHSYEVASDATPAQLAIDLDEVAVAGSLNPLNFGPIQIPGPSSLRRGFFDVTYVDESIRVSRGPFGELRVFTRN